MKIFRFLYRAARRVYAAPAEWKQKSIQRAYLTDPGASFFILGSPVYTNLGDSAILLAQICFLEKLGFSAGQIKEVTFSEYYKYRRFLQKWIPNDRLICGLGGGNMGNQWPIEEVFRYDMLSDFPTNPVVIFPQTIHYVGNTRERAKKDSVPYYDGRENLTLVAREKTSHEIMRQLYPNTEVLLTPDIVLYTTMADYGVVSQLRKGVLFCLRSDAEKSVDDSVWDTLRREIERVGRTFRQTDMYAETPVTKETRAECVRKKMQEFCGAELVITDRLHGMIFAAITETPCIVFSNYNHKVKGTYEWIRYLPYIRYVETLQEAETAIPELLRIKECHFDNGPLMPYYDKLAAVIRAKLQIGTADGE